MPGSDDFKPPYPQYRCPICGKELPLSEARMTVSCTEHSPGDTLEFSIREARAGDRKQVEKICDRAWGETEIDVFGRTFDVLSSENLVAMAGDDLVGLLSLSVHGGEQAIVMLSVYPEHQGQGVGSALVEEAAKRAAAAGLPFIKAAVSNDDIPSLYFYQRHGFVIYDVAVGSIADGLGQVVAGFSKIPIRDEIRLRRPLAV